VSCFTSEEPGPPDRGPSVPYHYLAGNDAFSRTIAGSDSGGGAGIQADLKTFAALQCFGTSAITAITAQNTKGVDAVQGIQPDILESQVNALFDDLPPDAIKTGMLFSEGIIDALVIALQKNCSLSQHPPCEYSFFLATRSRVRRRTCG